MPATFVLIPAAGDGAWSWHRVVDELHDRGHDGVAEDLPAELAKRLESWWADVSGGSR